MNKFNVPNNLMENTLNRAFTHALKTIDIEIQKEELSLFAKYYELLIKWNEKMNLISYKTPDEIILIHFVDCIIPLTYLDRKPQKILDIGSGQGLPAIPMKILRKNWSFTLLESSRKKVSFLTEVIRILDLNAIVVIRERAETMLKDPTMKDHYDGITSRATFKLPLYVGIAEYFVRKGGWILAMKGNLKGDELEETKKTLEKTNIYIEKTLTYNHPVTGSNRALLLLKKQ
ncbi:MAG: 16S rRNA (guanine(527)-N(7))-methyltransferase RsmG [Syntrophales bacterium]|nr:16S rRNA (guanine(527)-N(7))-methyltransferase RsmG [Syntrophales bacterium]